MSVVTVTTDVGTFTGNTIREAERAERKARKQHEIEMSRVSALRDEARCRAQAQAFRIVVRRLQGEKLLRHWDYIPHKEGANQAVVRTTGKDHSDDELLIDAPGRPGKLNVYRNTYRGYIECASGYAIAVVLELNAGIQVFAVGVADGVASCVHLPGYTEQDFIHTAEGN